MVYLRYYDSERRVRLTVITFTRAATAVVSVDLAVTRSSSSHTHAHDTEGLAWLKEARGPHRRGAWPPALPLVRSVQLFFFTNIQMLLRFVVRPRLMRRVFMGGFYRRRLAALEFRLQLAPYWTPWARTLNLTYKTRSGDAVRRGYFSFSTAA